MAGAAVLSLAACVTPPSDPEARAEYDEINDPLEPTNRYFFEVNRFLDIMVMRPVADTYRLVVPDFLRERVSDALDNMGEPVVFANTVLQGRFDDGMTTIARFLINSTLGIGGLFDVASTFGLPEKRGDFGQTLYSYGVGDGPYLVLPFLGPSNPRDAIGIGVDSVMDPVGIVVNDNGLDAISNGRFGGTAVSERSKYIEQLDALERTSIDFYAQMRSITRQRRAKQLNSSNAHDDRRNAYQEALEKATVSKK